MILLRSFLFLASDTILRKGESVDFSIEPEVDAIQAPNQVGCRETTLFVPGFELESKSPHHSTSAV